MIEYSIDKESLAQQYYWVGIGSASKNMALAHQLNNVLDTNWQRVMPLLSTVFVAHKTEHPLYLDYSAEDCISIFLQNITARAQLLPEWSGFDYILLHPKSLMSERRLNRCIGEVGLVFQYFLMPDFQQLNRLYKRNVEYLSEMLELYFFKGRHSLFLEDYSW